jgi:hypothetical protein
MLLGFRFHSAANRFEPIIDNAIALTLFANKQARANGNPIG